MPERRRREWNSSTLGFTLTELLVVLAVVVLIAAILLPVFARSREKARQTVCTSNLRQIGLATLQYAQDNDGLLFPSGYTDGAGGHVNWNYYTPPGQPIPARRIDTTRGMLGLYLKSAAVWTCPSAGGLHMHDFSRAVPSLVPSIYPSYSLNIYFYDGSRDSDHPVPLARVGEPAETIFVADSASQLLGVLLSTSKLEPPSRLRPSVHGRHGGLANVLWLDGHVSAREPVASAPDSLDFRPVSDLQALHLGDILKGPYTGNASTDDFYYELIKP